MKLKFFLLLLVASLMVANGMSAQGYSDSVYNNRLYYTCKVWGFVKYFHPRVADGTIDYDEVLLNTLPKVRNCSSNEDFNALLSDLINAPGEYPEPGTPFVEVPDNLKYNLVLGWFNDSLLSQEVRQNLTLFYQRFRPRNHRLVISLLGGMPSFLTEKDISGKNYLVEDQRIFGLFRFWNMIRYFYPYTNIMDVDWDVTLKDFIPRFIGFTGYSEFCDMWSALSARLNTSHATIGCPMVLEYREFRRYPNFSVVRIGDQTVIQYCDPTLSQIKPGNIIRKINGEDVKTLRDRYEEFSPHGNEATGNYQLDNFYVVRAPEGSNPVEIEDNQGVREVMVDFFNINHDKTRNDTVMPCFRDTILPGGKKVTVVNMARLYENMIPELDSGCFTSDCIIFDIRNYPNGNVVLKKLIDRLFNQPVHFAHYLIPDTRYPGTFNESEAIYEPATSESYQGQVILLVNERSISHAEFVAMALSQYPGAVVIGRQTAGADGNVLPVTTVGYITLHFEMVGIYGLNGSLVQRVGIPVDIPVDLTVEGIRSGTDEILEAAFQYISTSATPETFNPESKIRLYPIPAKDELNIDCEKWELGQKVIVMDLLGHVIIQIPLNDRQMKINTNSLTPGLYIVKVTGKNRNAQQFFVKN